MLKYILPAIVNAKRHYELASELEQRATPFVLILSPYQPPKEDIYAVAKPFLDAAGLSCVCIYENEDKTEQIERLKTSYNEFTFLTKLKFLFFKIHQVYFDYLII